MDRRTARTMAAMMVVRKAAKKLNVVDEDLFLFAMILNTSAETTESNMVAVAQAVMRAPPHVVENLHYVLDTVKAGVARMEGDPEFMEAFTAKLRA